MSLLIGSRDNITIPELLKYKTTKKHIHRHSKSTEQTNKIQKEI